jgi:hypothetical protein
MRIETGGAADTEQLCDAVCPDGRGAEATMLAARLSSSRAFGIPERRPGTPTHTNVIARNKKDSKCAPKWDLRH